MAPDMPARRSDGGRYGDITLKWGMTDSTELQNRMNEVTDGIINRQKVVIYLCDDMRNAIAEWEVHAHGVEDRLR